MAVDRPYKGIQLSVRLYPYERGVAQNVQINAIQLEDKRWQFQMFLRKTGGPLDEWESMNRDFLGLFRQQFLAWRFLGMEEKQRYVDLYTSGAS